MASHSRGPSPNDRDSSPQPLPDPEDECMGPAEPHSDQSASEDSSLTDSERYRQSNIYPHSFTPFLLRKMRKISL